MGEPQDRQLADNPLYAQRSERAKEDKPPSRSTPLGAVAEARAPGATSRHAKLENILAQDRDLVAGHFGTVYYKPVTVCGKDLKLEPLQPVIGTAVHGLDLAIDLEDPSMVDFPASPLAGETSLGFPWTIASHTYADGPVRGVFWGRWRTVWRARACAEFTARP